MNEINNQPQEIDLVELAKAVWDKRRSILKICAVGALVGIIIAFSLPKEYTTTVKMAPEGARSSGGGGMMDLAAMAGINLGIGSASEGINMKLYPDIVSSTPFIAEISQIMVQGKDMKEPMNLYTYVGKELSSPWWSGVVSAPMKAVGWTISLFKEKEIPQKDTLNLYALTREQTEVLAQLRSRISVSIEKKTDILTASAKMQDPVIATIVADSLVSKLEEYMTNYRTEKAQRDLEFTQELFEQAKAKYYENQRRYALYMDATQNASRQSTKAEQTKLSNEEKLAYNVYNQLAQQLEMAKIKLQEQTPVATIIEPASVPTKKSNASKPMVLIACIFLSGFIGVGKVIIKELLAKNSQDRVA